jgi:7,8-dihydropterin-6-yl-methyl-4-(beta-D-ribofuranosyl)aminobenzene 5'-phosphate synthase
VTGPMYICDGAMLTGEIVGTGSIPEQALVLTEDQEAALVTGCAHPGIVLISRRANELCEARVALVVGGFHLLRNSELSVKSVISELKGIGVRWAAPCHCTGDEAIALFRESYGDGFVTCEVGAVIDVSRLLRSSRTDSP